MKISAEIRKIGLANGIAAEELSDEDNKKQYCPKIYTLAAGAFFVGSAERCRNQRRL